MTGTGTLAGSVHVVEAGMVGFDRLGGEEIEAWHRLRAANPLLDSPYFHPGFSAAVHACVRPVQVAIGRDAGGRVCALLPCHRHRRLLRPAGWPAADFQGPVIAPGTVFPPALALTGGARRYAFDHLVDSGPGFRPWTTATAASPFLDVTGGLPGYRGRACRSGRDKMAEARRGLAKAERTYGRVRFEADTTDVATLDQLVTLKRAQYAATGVRDFLAEPEHQRLLRHLLGVRGSEFSGLLSALYAGDHLVAAHFGIRSGPVVHWWFPVFDRTFASMSPGWMLIHEFVAAAGALGITRIDLGKGDDEYKRRAKTGDTVVGEGLATRGQASFTAWRLRARLATAARSSSLGSSARRIVRSLRSAGRRST